MFQVYIFEYKETNFLPDPLMGEQVNSYVCIFWKQAHFKLSWVINWTTT